MYDENKGRLFTWLYNISRNVFIDYLRSKRYKQAKASFLSDDLSGLEQGTKTTGSLHDTIGLKKLVATLRFEEREVIDLVYFRGLTQQQAAEALSIPLGTVKTRVGMAIKKLRLYFEKDWEDGVQLCSN